jgi:hypothetical protein
LTNIYNRDEAQRSTFSGAAAPTTPAPVEGQLWYETDTDILHAYNGTSWLDLIFGSIANVFTANQSISSTASPQWSATDTTNTITARLSANDTEGRVGTTTNHPFSIETNGNVRATWDGSGNMSAGVVPLARMQVDEQSGSSLTAWTTSNQTLVTLSSMSVNVGDRVLISYRTNCTPAAGTTTMQAVVVQSAGTATGQWIYSGGPASTGEFSVFVSQNFGGTGSVGQAATTILRITGAGTLTLAGRAQTVGANSTSGLFYLNALVLRGT